MIPLINKGHHNISHLCNACAKFNFVQLLFLDKNLFSSLIMLYLSLGKPKSQGDLPRGARAVSQSIVSTPQGTSTNLTLTLLLANDMGQSIQSTTEHQTDELGPHSNPTRCSSHIGTS